MVGQQCWELLCPVGSGVQTDATTPNIGGPTMLGVVVSVMVVVCKQMQQLIKTPSNSVYRRTQHLKSNNAGSCWPTMLRPFAGGL